MIRYKLFLLPAVFFVLNACLHQAAKQDEELLGWRTIFLKENWEIVGDSVWREEANTIIADEGEAVSFLRMPTRYSDFHLKLEFWVDAETNSGIFFRCNSPVGINPINCYEANIWDEHPKQEFRTGAIVMRAKPVAMANTLNKWNSYEVIAKGKDITIKVNNEVTALLQDDTYANGYLALQYAGKGTVKFRNIYLQKL